MHSHDVKRARAPQPGRRLFFPAVSMLCCIVLLSSCVPGMQGGLFSGQSGSSSGLGGSFASLPKVEVSPPAKVTKGAPAYTMRFHTMASSMPMGGADRVMTLRAVSHPGPAGGVAARAYHMIPAAMNMGEYLPLLPPDRQQASPSPGGSGTASEPQRFVIKIYWGCGETVRHGRPRVIDTSRLAKGGSIPAAMGGMAAMAGGRSGGGYAGGGKGDLKPGWAEALWPNKEDARQAPSSASLVGDHFLHGNFLPHMRFSMGAQHDIMEKLALSAERSSLAEAIPITWKKVSTAIGYHLMAFGVSDARKEMVIWTSSENPDVNVAGQFLDTPVVRKHIASKVVMPADRDRCVIPAGIFRDMDMVMVSGTAWGGDYWASEPPRPANPPKNWKPDWTVKGQFLSTGNLMLGRSGVPGGSGVPGAPGAPGALDILRGLF